MKPSSAMLSQSRAVRRGGWLRSHHAIARKKGSDSVMRRKSSVLGLTGCAAYESLMRIGRTEKASTPNTANAMPQPRYAAGLRGRFSTFFPAEDRPQYAAQHLPAELRADAAGCALGHRFQHALRLPPAARPGLAEQDVRDRIGALFRLRGLRLGAAFELLVGRFAVDGFLVMAEDVRGLEDLPALLRGERPELAAG